MPKLTILRGVSGSGKSTWARNQPGAVVVSRDAIRVMLFGSVADTADYYKVDSQAAKDALSARERKVTVVHDGMIEGSLRNHMDVIVDNTNIEWKYVTAIAKIGYRCGAEVEVKVFDVSRNTAIERDRMRGISGGRHVGEGVIHKQHQRFQGNKTKELPPVFVPEPYNGTPGQPKAFLVDIDGTLAHMKDRSPFDWKKVGLDDVDEVIAEIVDNLRFSQLNYYQATIVMSGRDESCRIETENWLDKHGIHFDYLFMRPEKDMRPDNIVKAELFDKYVRDNHDVQFVLDDRQQVVDMWRSMGLTCLQVAPGDF